MCVCVCVHMYNKNIYKIFVKSIFTIKIFIKAFKYKIVILLNDNHSVSTKNFNHN